MEKEQKDLLVNEVNKIIQGRVEFINENYPLVRDAYQMNYDWPEMDTLRHEITLCLIFGLHQAAITLANHLGESLLKSSLILYETLAESKKDTARSQHSIESFVAMFRPARKKYGTNDFGDNINRACTVGLITKAQKKELHEMREGIRNAYSHSDKEKAFGEQRIPTQAVRFEGNKLVVEQQETPLLAELVIAHGLAQAMQAREEAIPYFLYMHDLVRQIRDKLFGSSIKGVQEQSIQGG
jgi:hypothetical protein